MQNSKEPMYAPRASNLYQPRTQLQTLTRTYMVIIKDHDCMTTIDKYVNWIKLTHLLSKFPLTLGPPFEIHFYFKKINSLFIYTYYKKISTSCLCILCTLMPPIIPLRTFTLVRTWYEESTPLGLAVDEMGMKYLTEELIS